MPIPYPLFEPEPIRPISRSRLNDLWALNKLVEVHQTFLPGEEIYAIDLDGQKWTVMPDHLLHAWE